MKKSLALSKRIEKLPMVRYELILSFGSGHFCFTNDLKPFILITPTTSTTQLQLKAEALGRLPCKADFDEIDRIGAQELLSIYSNYYGR